MKRGKRGHGPLGYFGRRRFLQLGAGAAALGLAASCGLDSAGQDPLQVIRPDGPIKKPAPRPDWLRDARVAGFEAYVGQSALELKSILDRMADEHVSVVEIDPELSGYLSPEEFQKQLDLLHVISEGCHLRGMRAVAYYPTLEVLTKNADKTAHTMYKDHPDWIQVSIDDEPNVFVGGGGRVFWVEPGEESAWMCPTSGYVDYFNDRVAKLAGTSLDGVWGDVPLFSDIVGVWPCVNPTCNARFKDTTGFDPPTKVDWDDPVFRHWIDWRHDVIWEFEQDVYTAAKKVRQDFEVIIETVTMDYNAGTVQGLDGGSRDDGDVYRVWEVDAVSDATGMRNADKDDWVSMVAMMRHGRCSSYPRPSWIFSYGLEDDDAEHVMALAIVAGNNPYESKIPVMNTSTGSAYRKRMFGWLERNIAVYRAKPAAAAAVIFSSSSRDFLDRNAGVGLYTSLNPADKLWWSTRDLDSAKVLDYLGDYRGTIKTLMHAHVPHDIVTTPHVTPEVLAHYRLLVIPSAVALSVGHLDAIVGFVEAGGTVLLSGPDLGHYDAAGDLRDDPELLVRLAIDPKATGWVQSDRGKGRIYFNAKRTGREYFNTEDAAVLATYRQAAEHGGTQLELGNAPLPIFTDVRTDGQDALFLCANLDGLGEGGVGKYTPRDASFEVRLAVAKAPKEVIVSVPDAGVEDKKAAFTYVDGRVRFALQVHSLALATIRS